VTSEGFTGDLAARLAGRVQLTTDGRSAYLSAIIEKFPVGGVDYGVLMKSTARPATTVNQNPLFTRADLLD
jgi:hypothetical protein